MRRGVVVALGAVAVVTGVLGVVLVARERGGPPHRDVTLAGDVPATFYLPNDVSDPPAVVVGHGYSGDRATMSSLARSLASAGYAVLAIDFRGHGANPNGFAEGDRGDDLVAALDRLEGSPDVDGGRLALLGHSMGGHAVLDVARRDPRVDASIVLGAAAATEGARNVLFLFGEHEPAPSGATRAERIDGADHITILWFDETVAEAVEWLDAAFGTERDVRAGVVDPRLGIALAYFACAVVMLAALGLAAGRIVRPSREEPAAGAGEVVLVLAALAAAAPIAAFLDPAGFLGAGFGDVVSYLVVAGAILYLPHLRRRRPRADRPLDWVYRAAAAAAIALLGAFVVLAPLGGVTHRLVPTLGRLLLVAIMAPLLGLFFVQLQALVRRGPLWRATAGSVAAHAAVLLALGAGVVADLFPGVVGLALPLLAGVFALVEIFGVTAYAASRSGAFVGIVEALWLAGIAAVAMPLPS